MAEQCGRCGAVHGFDIRPPGGADVHADGIDDLPKTSYAATLDVEMALAKARKRAGEAYGGGERADPVAMASFEEQIAWLVCCIVREARRGG